MGNRGPAIQPEAVAKAKGTYQQVRYRNSIKLDNVAFLKEIPTAPVQWEDKTKVFWYRMLRKMIDVGGWIARTDLAAFELACHDYNILVETVSCKKYELSTNGKKLVSAEWRIRQDAQKNFLRFMKEFGWSPGSPSSKDSINKATRDEDIINWQLWVM